MADHRVSDDDDEAFEQWSDTFRGRFFYRSDFIEEFIEGFGKKIDSLKADDFVLVEFFCKNYQRS